VIQELRGAKTAALQTVIILRRWPEARALSTVEGERRSREPNDLDRAQPRPPLANC